MRKAILFGALLAALPLLQAGLASPSYSYATTRDQNRQLIVAQYGLSYDASATTRVVTGFPGALVERFMPLSDAIEVQLDAMDRNHVSLAQMTAAQSNAASNQEPTWPLQGAVWFHEVGWKESGARCPAVHPFSQSGTLNTTLDAAYPDLNAAVVLLTNQPLFTGDPRIGDFTTSVSRFSTSGFGQVALSQLQHYHNATDRSGSIAAGSSAPTTYNYPRAGWVLTAGTASDPDYIEVNCTEPGATRGQVSQNAYVATKVNRIA